MPRKTGANIKGIPSQVLSRNLLKSRLIESTFKLPFLEHRTRFQGFTLVRAEKRYNQIVLRLQKRNSPTAKVTAFTDSGSRTLFLPVPISFPDLEPTWRLPNDMWALGTRLSLYTKAWTGPTGLYFSFLFFQDLTNRRSARPGHMVRN